jgi:hypothetical protein
MMKKMISFLIIALYFQNYLVNAGINDVAGVADQALVDPLPSDVIRESEITVTDIFRPIVIPIPKCGRVKFGWIWKCTATNGLQYNIFPLKLTYADCRAAPTCPL